MEEIEEGMMEDEEMKQRVGEFGKQMESMWKGYFDRPEDQRLYELSDWEDNQLT